MNVEERRAQLPHDDAHATKHEKGLEDKNIATKSQQTVYNEIQTLVAQRHNHVPHKVSK